MDSVMSSALLAHMRTSTYFVCVCVCLFQVCCLHMEVIQQSGPTSQFWTDMWFSSHVEHVHSI